MRKAVSAVLCLLTIAVLTSMVSVHRGSAKVGNSPRVTLPSHNAASEEQPAHDEATLAATVVDGTLPSADPDAGSAFAQPQERAVVALIAHGWNASGYEDTATIKGRKLSMELTLKGLLRTVSRLCTLHLYFIVGPEDEQRIRQFLAPATAPLHTAVSYSFLQLDEVQLAVWLHAIGHRPSHRTGPAGNIKFFYPLLFPHEERLLMLDSDVLIGRDVCQLWAEFQRFPDGALFGFVPQKPKVDPRADNEFNAGVGLLHLGRMRQAGWLSLAKQAILHWAAQGMHPPCCAHGDQSVFHMIRFLQPPALRLLPRWWNINKCHKYQRIDRHPPGSFVGIVHLGCCKMCTRAKLWPRWVVLLNAIDAFAVQGAGPPLVELPIRRCGEGRVVLETAQCPPKS